MKKIIICIILSLGFLNSCKKCEYGILVVTNPYNQTVDFFTTFTGMQSIAPNKTLQFQENFITEFTWTASRTVIYQDDSRDVFRGSGTLTVNCGEKKQLTIVCDD